MSTSETLQAPASQHRPLAPQAPLRIQVWAHPAGKIGMVLTVLMVLLAVVGFLLAEALTGYSPTEAIDQPFAAAGIFGTDVQGRSVDSRVLAGGLTLLTYSVTATVIGVVLGTILGVLGGVIGGIIDWIVLRLNEVVTAFPPLVLALLAIVVFGPTGWVLVLVIGLTNAPWTAQAVRDVIVRVKPQDYVLAARMAGMSRWRIFIREIAPYLKAPLAAETAARLTWTLVLLASLSFIGLGVQPPSADWGLMISENLSALSAQPWGVLLPAAAIVVLTLGLRLIAHAIAQATTTEAMPETRGAS